MAELIPDIVVDLTVSKTGDIMSANALSVPVEVNAVDSPIFLYSTETIGPRGPGGPSAVSNTPGNVATIGSDYLILVPGPVTGDATASQVVKGNDSRLSEATTSTRGLLRKLDGVSAHVLDGTGNWSTPVGAGDMLRSDYDPNNDKIVEHAVLADTVPLSGITGTSSGFTPSAHAGTHLPGSTDPIASATRTASGLVPTPSNDPNTFLSGLATFIRVLPAGVILPFGGGTAPVGFLLCDGTSYPTATYPDLFAVLQYTFGGSGANFNLPDMRGRVPVGAGAGPGLTNRVRGGTVGEESHALSIGELAAHTHGMDHYHYMDHYHLLSNHTHLGVDHLHSIPAGQFSHTHTDSGHSHSQYGGASVVGYVGGSGVCAGVATNTGVSYANIAANTLPAGGTGAMDRGATTGGPSPNNTNYASQTSSAWANTYSASATYGPWANTGSTGSGTPHQNCQPSLFLAYIIKT